MAWPSARASERWLPTAGTSRPMTDCRADCLVKFAITHPSPDDARGYYYCFLELLRAGIPRARTHTRRRSRTRTKAAPRARSTNKQKRSDATKQPNWTGNALGTRTRIIIALNFILNAHNANAPTISKIYFYRIYFCLVTREAIRRIRQFSNLAFNADSNFRATMRTLVVCLFDIFVVLADCWRIIIGSAHGVICCCFVLCFFVLRDGKMAAASTNCINSTEYREIALRNRAATANYPFHYSR